MPTQTMITVRIESMPTDMPDPRVLLARPAFAGGAFLIDQRVPSPLFDAMKQAGAWYLDAEWLEDMDYFDADPGWRYNIDALKVLLTHGYTLNVLDAQVSDPAGLDALFTVEALVAYAERQAEASAAEVRAARERIARERIAREEAGRQARGAAYAAWKAEHLGPLTYTTARPTNEHDLTWDRAADFPKGTPGSWYDSGDHYQKTTIDGQIVYRCYYGNAVVFYAPRPLALAWCEREYGGPAWLFRSVTLDCYGSDVARLLLEEHGEDFYRAQITAPLPVRSDDDYTMRAVERYTLPAVVLGRVVVPEAVLEQCAAVKTPRGFSPNRPRMVYRLPDGSHEATAYGYEFWPLNAQDNARIAPYPIDPTIGRLPRQGAEERAALDSIFN